MSSTERKLGNTRQAGKNTDRSDDGTTPNTDNGDGHTNHPTDGPTSAADSSSPSPSPSLRPVFYLLGHQLLTRIATFGLNIMVVRHIGPVAYGISAVNLYLINTIILFIAREAIRRSTLRYAAPFPIASPSLRHAYERQVMVNISWLAVLLSIPLSIITLIAFIHGAPTFTATPTVSASTLNGEYRDALSLYTLAAIIELLSEPCYILFQKAQRVRSRVLIDAVAVLMRCIVTFVTMKVAAMNGQKGSGLMPFAYGQMTYALIITVVYYSTCIKDTMNSSRGQLENKASSNGDIGIDEHPIIEHIGELLPRRLPVLPPADHDASSHISAVDDGDVTNSPSSSSYLDPSLIRLSGHLSLQSLEKLALSEGEKFALVTLNSSPQSLHAAGVYSLVTNLGSMVARIILQPLEETALMQISITMAQVTNKKEGNQDATLQDEPQPPTPSRDAVSAYSSSVRIFGVLLHVVILLGLLLISFGPPYSFVLLHLLYGSKWSSTDAPTALSYYCVYIFVMAINGVTEAFVAAVISARQMKGYNTALIAFSAVYLVACSLLIQYGSIGLIAANCINMTMRIAYSVYFIRRFYVNAPQPTSHDDNVVTPAMASSSSPSSHLQQLLTLSIPARCTLLVFLISALVTNASSIMLDIPTSQSESLMRFTLHIGVGVACVSGVLISVWMGERHFLREMKQLLASRKKKAE